MRKLFSSLRARVLLLIAIPFAVMLGMTLYHTLGEREERLAQARTRVLDTARVMAGEQQRIIEHVHQVLSSTALLPEVRRGVASEECNRALTGQLQQEPSLAAIALAVANGDVICNATPTAQRVSIADRDHFKGAIQTRKFAVGGYVISRSAGKPSLGFALPLLDEAGVPRTVVAASLSLAWLKQELARAQLPEGARVTVVDGEGLVLASHPDPEGWVGKRAAELPLLKSILDKGGEGTEEDVGLDGQRQVFGFVPLHRTASGQTYLWIAIPKDVIVGPTERAFVVSLLVELALLVLTFGAVWVGTEGLLVRRAAAVIRAANELGNGNLAARTGVKASDDEIGQLAQSFDRMAEELQTKVTQLSRAVRALRVLSAGNRTLLRAKQGEQHLLEEMCRAIGEAGRYRMVWAGYAENDVEKSIRPVAHWGGVADGYFENVKLTWSETENGRAPPGRAIRTGIPVAVQNSQREAGPQPWQDYALRCGCGASLALPLRIDDHVIGVLNICAEEPDAFSDEEIELLSESAADLSFGIASQRAELEHADMKVTLKSAEERFRAAAEESLDALFITRCVRDEGGHIADFEFTDINGHAAEMVGMAREKVIGQKLSELFPINRTGGFFDKYAQVVATGTPLEEEFQIDTPEIKARWLRHQVVRVGDGIAIYSRDITMWKEAGAHLKESEERLRLATAAAHMGAWTWDLKSNRFSLSDGTGPVFGLPPGEGFRTPEELIEAIHPEDSDMLARALTEGREKGTPFRAEFRTIWPDGTLHWVEGRSYFYRGATGVVERGAGIAMDITKRKAGELALIRSNRALRTLSACNKALIDAVSEPELLNTVCRRIVETGGYGMAWVGFAEQDPAKTVRVVAQYGIDEEYLGSMNITWSDTEQGSGPTGTAIRTGTTQVSQNILTNPSVTPLRDAALARGLQTSIAMPLKGLSGTTGALTLYARERDAFIEGEVRLLEELADDLTFGITMLRTRVERDGMTYAHLHHEEILRKSLEESIQAIVNTVEMRDPYTAGHQKRVAQLAVAIASDLGLAEDAIHGIQLAATVHDLGKIRVPAEILARPSKLTDVEFMLIKAHPQAGYDIVKGIEFPWPIADMVLQHHERLDGSGYPQGLKGDQILLGARIMAVADVLEAMASHRPYRPTLGIDVALAEIERGRGTAYDPAVADACLKLFRESRFAFQT